MKFTLIEGVQEILSALESDEVNSISDTVESYAVALMFQSVYYDMYNDLGLKEHNVTFGLDASGDANKPVLMTVPETITRVEQIKYDNKSATDTYARYEEVLFKEFSDFMDTQQQLSEQTNIDSMTVTGLNNTFEMLYITDKHPQFFTVYDNNIILFDSIDLSVDTTLQNSKCLCVGKAYPAFTLDDDFTPELDPAQFRYLLHRVKVRAFAELKQVENSEAAGEARRQKITTQINKDRVNTKPNMDVMVVAKYGRK